MGTKYTTIAASGFNSSPPADDGSQSASNLISWSGIKTKLADPLHVEIDAVNTALVAALNTSVRQITVADSTVAGDHWRTVEIAPTVSNTITVSLGDAVTMTTTYLVAVRNSSTISQIISRVTAGDKIDGVAGNITIPSKSTILFTTNSVPDGYLSLARFGPVIDSDPIVVGGTDGTKKVRLEVDGLTTGTTRVFTARDADFDIGAATQAEQETGTINTASVTPGRQQFHPSAAKAWVIFTGATGAITASYNVGSVTRNAAGDYTINFTTVFSSANYGIALTASNTANAYVMAISVANPPTASACRILNPIAAADPGSVCAAFFGDQ